MEPQNQLLYQHFQQTVNEMKQRQTTLVTDIATVEEQLVSMKRELANLETSLVSHQGGMQTIELLTNNNIALVENPGDQPLALSQFPVTQQVAQAIGIPPIQQQQPPPPPPQVAPSQQQYAQQPTQQATPPQPAITPQAQQAFAPTQYPSPGDISAAQAIQGPQIVQGPPPTTTE